MKSVSLVEFYKMLKSLPYGPEAIECPPIPSSSARLDLAVCIYPSHQFLECSYPLCKANFR